MGLLPEPEALAAFENDPAGDKRPRLVRRLLADRRGYAEHWMSFFNDALRNALELNQGVADKSTIAAGGVSSSVVIVNTLESPDRFPTSSEVIIAK